MVEEEHKDSFIRNFLKENNILYMYIFLIILKNRDKLKHD